MEPRLTIKINAIDNVAVAVHDLMIGVRRDHDEVRFVESKAIVIAYRDHDASLQSVLDLKEGVLGIAGQQAFGLTADHSCPENRSRKGVTIYVDTVFIQTACRHWVLTFL